MVQLTSISVARAWQASILTLLTPTPPLLWVAWGSVLPGVLCSAAPCGGWQALPWATGAGRHMSHPPPSPTCSAKACGILGLLGQRFSDIAELWLGQEQIGGVGCHLN